MAFTEDLAPFFGDFGITATVAGASVRGIFDNSYFATLGFTAGTSPVLIVRTADVPTVAQEHVVVIGSVRYTVGAIEPDGTGLTLLRLERT